MKKILVPTDFSPVATHATRFALELAKAVGGSVHLFHVIELPVMHDTTLMPTLSFEQEYLDEATKLANKKFEQIVRVARGESFITFSVEFGTTSTVIMDVIRKRKSELVVMGTSGASGLKEYFIGSNTEKIVRLSPIPVWTIPGQLNLRDIKNIVIPTSLYGDQDAVVVQAKNLQKVLKAKTHVLYINTPALFRADNTSVDLLEQFARRHKLTDHITHIWNDVSEESGVVNFASRMGSCLVIMATHGRRGLAHLMTGSIAEDVVNHIHFPVLTIHMTSRKTAKGNKPS